MSTNRTRILAPRCAIAALAWMLSAAMVSFGNEPLSAGLMERATYRGPVDLVLADDESWAVTLNELSDTLSLVDLAAQRIVVEVPCAGRPAACARLPDNELLVSCRNAGLLRRFRVEYHDGRPVDLQSVVDITTGYEPLGVAVAPKLKQQPDRAYVGLMASGEVAEIDLSDNRLLRRWSVGKWPRYLAVSPDGTKLAVGLSGESTLAVFDLPSGELAYDEPLSGSINMGHMRCSANGQYVYFPWMIYRSNPIDPGNIRRGWVLASRIARVRLDGPATREAISLDVPGMAVADPHGLAVTPDQSTMAVTSAGTHELLVYSIEQMPFVGTGGPGDLIDERLLRNRRAFTRIELGGRPLGIESARDNRTLWIVNHTLDALQRVDLESRRVTAVISLGRPSTDSSEHIVHLGMEIFHDATRSLDQWYSCRSCHLDGGSNAKAMDTWNDGSELTVKAVLPLTGVADTGPWTWHGWQQDLDESIQNSFVSTMQGSQASADDVAAVRAYLASLRSTPNPFLQALDARSDDGYAAPNDRTDANMSSFAQLVAQGSELFHSDAVGCANCHSGPLATDGQIHDVGLGSESDKYEGYNTPSLVGVYQKARLLHDGRAKSLRDVLTKWHTPSEVGGGAELSDSQLDQLIAYLKTL
ncbi:MAG: c-type cytochrome [Pirellulaceae bacterium]|jgi:cytochrome c peroxidase